MQQPAVLPDDASEAALTEHIRAERLRFVFVQSPLPIVFSPSAGLLLLVATWSDVAHSGLITWVAGLAVIAAVRVTLVLSFPKATPDAAGVVRWERTSSPASSSSTPGGASARSSSSPAASPPSRRSSSASSC